MRYMFYLIALIGYITISPIAEAKSTPPPAKEQHEEKKADKETPLFSPIDDTPATQSSEEATESYQHAFSRMIFSLIALIVLLVGGVWFLKRLSKGKFRFGMHKQVEILEKRPLSPKTALYVVRIDGKKVLISESQLEVRRLCTLEEIEES